MPKIAEILNGTSEISAEALLSIAADLEVDIAPYLPSSLDHFHRGPGPPRSKENSVLPLHCKDVARSLNFDALENLPSVDPACVAQYSFWKRYAVDASCYADVPIKRTIERQTRLSAKELDMLISQEHIAEIDPHEIEGEVIVFTRPEPAKNRRRRIGWTFDINECTPKSNSPTHPISITRKTEVISAVHDGEWAISLDFAGWFDQIPIAEEVSRRMCFRVGDKYFCLLTLAMGMTHSVGLACNVTDRLLDFPRKSSRVCKCIDNILFVGTRDAVLADAATFRDRCAAAGAILNDAEKTLEELLMQRGEWCGVFLDLNKKTVQLTQKCLDRTKLSWALRHHWTWRGLLACMGLLFWSYGLVSVQVQLKFALLSFLSRISADLQDRPELLDAPARIWPSALKDIEEWVSRIAANEPRAVPDRRSDAEWIIATDASLYGWGYVALCSATGQTTSFGAPWSKEAVQQFGGLLGRSTWAEPRAVVNALCHWRCPERYEVARVLVLSDNSATVSSFNRGFSTRSLVLNQQIARLRSQLPSLDIELRHIEGSLNPADGPSRGVPLLAPSLAEAAEQLRLVVGA